ncbi:uroporphyrinogen-III synthase [Xanthobacteraceae bacterium A53D]
MRLLVTRPEPAAGTTARRLAAMGHHVLVDPMLRIAPTGAAVPDGPFEAIAFSSINGVAAFAAHAQHRALPAFAVGTRTAAAARAAGFTDVTDCMGDVGSLAAALARLPHGARVLHAAGEDRAGDLPGLLAPSAITVTVAVLYRSVMAETLAPGTIAAIEAGTLDGVLHYSPRSAAAVLRAAAVANVSGPFLRLRHLCLSQAVAAPLEALGAHTQVAASPDEDALLTLL